MRLGQARGVLWISIILEGEVTTYLRNLAETAPPLRPPFPVIRLL